MNAMNGIIQVTVTGIVHSLVLAVLALLLFFFVWIWDRNIINYHYALLASEYMDWP